MEVRINYALVASATHQLSVSPVFGVIALSQVPCPSARRIALYDAWSVVQPTWIDLSRETSFRIPIAYWDGSTYTKIRMDRSQGAGQAPDKEKKTRGCG